MASENAYYYLHANGEIIRKPAIVVDPVGPREYFSGPFVQKWWHASEWPDDIPEPE